MELHTRDAEDAVALAQLGAAAIILWHNVPRGVAGGPPACGRHHNWCPDGPDAQLMLQRLIKGHQLTRE